MTKLSIRPYTIAASSQPGLWRVDTYRDGIRVRRDLLATPEAQRALDAFRAGTLAAAEAAARLGGGL